MLERFVKFIKLNIASFKAGYAGKLIITHGPILVLSHTDDVGTKIDLVTADLDIATRRQTVLRQSGLKDVTLTSTIVTNPIG